MTDRRRYFVVVFKDGSMRAVYPSDDDPMQFEEQVTSSKGDGLIRHAPDSRDVIFQPDHSDLADEVFRIWKEGECGGADEQ
jgi:hypothetical protein